MTRPWSERKAEAQRPVDDGRLVLERQRALIVRRHAQGLGHTEAERILALFERTQAIFEFDLEKIRRERR